MSEDATAETLELPFKEQVLKRLDTLGVRLSSLERLIAEREFDTKPMWENLLKQFADMREDVNNHLGNFDRKLDVVNKELLQVKADQSNVVDRVSKLERELEPQIVGQDHQF